MWLSLKLQCLELPFPMLATLRRRSKPLCLDCPYVDSVSAVLRHYGYVGKCWKCSSYNSLQITLNQRAPGRALAIRSTTPIRRTWETTIPSEQASILRPRPHRTVSGTSRAVEIGDIRRWRSRRTSQPMASTNCRLAGAALATITSSSHTCGWLAVLEHLYLWLSRTSSAITYAGCTSGTGQGQWHAGCES